MLVAAPRGTATAHACGTVLGAGGRRRGRGGLQVTLLDTLRQKRHREKRRPSSLDLRTWFPLSRLWQCQRKGDDGSAVPKRWAVSTALADVLVPGRCLEDEAGDGMSRVGTPQTRPTGTSPGGTLRHLLFLTRSEGHDNGPRTGHRPRTPRPGRACRSRHLSAASYSTAPARPVPTRHTAHGDLTTLTGVTVTRPQCEPQTWLPAQTPLNLPCAAFAFRRRVCAPSTQHAPCTARGPAPPWAPRVGGLSRRRSATPPTAGNALPRAANAPLPPSFPGTPSGPSSPSPPPN